MKHVTAGSMFALDSDPSLDFVQKLDVKKVIWSLIKL